MDSDAFTKVPGLFPRFGDSEDLVDSENLVDSELLYEVPTKVYF